MERSDGERITKRIENKAVFHACEGDCLTCDGTRCGFVQAMVDRLAAYEDAEEQGRLVRLPYAVGDLFWAIAYSDPRVIHVRLYQITNHYEQGYILWVENVDHEMDWWKLPLGEFEKWSHFNSREEAEAKLNGR